MQPGAGGAFQTGIGARLREFNPDTGGRNLGAESADHFARGIEDAKRVAGEDSHE